MHCEVTNLCYLKKLVSFSPWLLLTVLHEQKFWRLYFILVLTLNIHVAFYDSAKSLSPGTGSRSLQNNAEMNE